MIGAKAFFVVTAGLLPEEFDPQHTRQWSYTSLDYEADKAAIDAMANNGSDGTKFLQCRNEALAYARDLIDPSVVNWVRLEFVWL